MYFTLCCFSFSKNCFKVTKSGQELQGLASSPWTECGAPEAPGLSLDFSSSPPPHGLEIICICMCSSGVSASYSVFWSYAPFPQLFPDPSLLYLPNFLRPPPKEILQDQSVPPIYSIYSWLCGLPLERGMFLKTHSVLHYKHFPAFTYCLFGK